MAAVLNSPLYFLLLGALCGMVGFRLGWRTGHRLAQPLIQGLLGSLAFAASWRASGALAGALAVGGWAIGTSLVALVVFRADPERADRQVLRARVYRESMVDWLRTERGPESRPGVTVGSHLVELVVYCGVATLSGNVLSIVMGAILINYMNAYVARLLLAARRIGTVSVLAWNVWSVVRVAAYVTLGAACAAPVGAVLGYPPGPGETRLLLTLGAVGVLLDLALKLALSRPVGRLLRSAVDLELLATRPGEQAAAIGSSGHRLDA